VKQQKQKKRPFSQNKICKFKTSDNNAGRVFNSSKTKKDNKKTIIAMLVAAIVILSVVLLNPANKKNDLVSTNNSSEGKAGSKIAKDEKVQFSIAETKTKINSYHLNMVEIKPFMEKYCYTCHNGKKQKGDVRLDNLPVKLTGQADAQLWQDALDAVNLGIMTPEEAKKTPSSKELEDFIANLTAELQKARTAFGDSGGEVVLHRLNRREYVNTVYDLLGASVNAKTLPQDGLHEGFDTVGESLFFSSLHFERYMETGTQIIKQIINKGKKPQFQKKKIDGEWKYEKAKHQLTWFTRKRARLKKDMDAGKTFKQLRFNSQADMMKSYNHNKLVMDRYKIFTQVKGHDTGFLPYRVDHPITEHFKFKVPDVDVEGDYILRIRCAVTGIPGKKERRYRDVQQLAIKDQTINNGEPEDLQRYYNISAPYENPEMVEYKFRMIPGQKREIDLTGERGVNNYRLWIDWVEWSGPHNVQWPSKGYKTLFFKGEGQANTDAYAKEIIENLALKAYRGQKPSKSFLDTLHKLYLKNRKHSSFEEALTMPLACILASPKFIYKYESKQSSERELNQLEIANRLSYFLWNSLPDHKLSSLAKSNKLLNANNLKSEITRLLKDKRSDRFIESFVTQWLELDKLNGLTIDQDLLYSARHEPIEFFKEILHKNLSYSNLVDSKFVMVNQTLAKHYKLPSSKDKNFKAVKLPNNSVRGGLIGQAAFMIMTSEGKRTSIVQRGTWVLEKLLHAPPPPPPPNVPQLESNKKKNMNARELLSAHSEIAQCRSCHKRIDPLGYPLENFDSLGSWRPLGGRNKIDTSGKMPDGKRTFKDFHELKKRLMEDKESTLKGLLESLLIYSLGRPLSFSDRSVIDNIIAKSRKGDDGMQSIIKNIILSPIFKVK
jgi:hypothetical protein